MSEENMSEENNPEEISAAESAENEVLQRDMFGNTYAFRSLDVGKSVGTWTCFRFL